MDELEIPTFIRNKREKPAQFRGRPRLYYLKTLPISDLDCLEIPVPAPHDLETQVRIRAAIFRSAQNDGLRIVTKYFPEEKLIRVWRTE